MAQQDGSVGPPLTSVVISTRNRPALLSDAVRSVLDGEVTPTEFVVVDQSDVAHPELSRSPGFPGVQLKYLWGPATGLSLGRNTGIGASTGEILVFIDDDVLVPRTWLGHIVDVLVTAGERAVVTGRVVPGGPEAPGNFAPSLILDTRPVTFTGRPGRDVLSSMTMAMFRSAVLEVGPFDERLGAGSRFPSSEDNDFGYRLLEAGYRIVFDPDVVVTHRAWRGSHALLPLRWDYGRGQGAYFVKHASRRDGYMWRRLGRDVWRHLRRAPKRLLHQPRDGMADLVYGCGVLTGAAQWSVATRFRG